MPSAVRCDLEGTHDGNYYLGKPAYVPSTSLTCDVANEYSQARLTRTSFKIQRIIQGMEAERELNEATSRNDLAQFNTEEKWSLDRALDYHRTNEEERQNVPKPIREAWVEVYAVHHLLMKAALKLEFLNPRSHNLIVRECGLLACQYASRRKGFKVRGVTVVGSGSETKRKSKHIVQRHALCAGVMYICAKKNSLARSLADVCRVFQPEETNLSLKPKGVARAIAELKIEFPEEMDWNRVGNTNRSNRNHVRARLGRANNQHLPEPVVSHVGTVSASDTDSTASVDPVEKDGSSDTVTEDKISMVDFSVIRGFDMPVEAAEAVKATIRHCFKFSSLFELNGSAPKPIILSTAVVYLILNAGKIVQMLAKEHLASVQDESMENKVVYCDKTTFWLKADGKRWSCSADQINDCCTKNKCKFKSVIEFYNKVLYPNREVLLSVAHDAITRGCSCGNCCSVGVGAFSIQIAAALIRKASTKK